MSTPRGNAPSTAWLVLGIVALALLVTGTVLPRLLSAAVFALAVVMYLRSGTQRRGERDPS